jgi:hypothetical protein
VAMPKCRNLNAVCTTTDIIPLMIQISKLPYHPHRFLPISDSTRRDRAHKADHFLQKMDKVHEYIRATGSACRPVRIAIIDTGAHFDACARNSFGPRLRECRSWLHPEQDARGANHPGGTDHDGHGTHCTSAVLRCAPEDCEVYVAQVFADHPKCSFASEREAGTNLRVAQVCLVCLLAEP